MRYYPRADRDYEVLWTGGGFHSAAIKGLGCNYCSYFNSRLGFKKSRSGLGRYNRMRADMVKHIFKCHKDKIKGAGSKDHESKPDDPRGRNPLQDQAK